MEEVEGGGKGGGERMKYKKPTRVMPDKSYRKEFHCDNCGYDYRDTFEFGEVAYQGACPVCGVAPEQLSKPTYLH